MTAEQIQRKLAAILAADVEGYSRRMSLDELGTLSTLSRHRTVMDALIARHRGRVANTAGDSVLAEFASVVDAVECAVAVQTAIEAENEKLAAEQRMRFRIGVHVGDVLAKGGDLFGEGVNIAARLQALAEAGSIWISAAVRDHLGKRLSLTFHDMGQQFVKNIGEPVCAYRVGGSEPASPVPAEETGLPLPDKPSIAVLPFQNLSGDSEKDYFADGVVEEIITALSRLRWLFVIARNSSFTYKGRAVDVRQVGRELGVRYVLEGSVRKARDRVRITGQLIDTATGGHLWAERFEGPLEDIFDLQDHVTSSVVGAIAPKLEEAEIERARRKRTENLDAYDYYLRGLASVYRWTREGVDEALGLFCKAIELDVDFGSAYGVAAWCYIWRMFNGWMSDRTHETAEVARLVARAAALGKNDAVALSFSGFALGVIVGDFAAGAAFVDRALGLDPNLATGWYVSGILRALLGDHDVAIEHAARAMRLSPLDPMMFYMHHITGLAHFLAGRNDEARRLAERASWERPNFLPSLRLAAASNALAGRMDEARGFIARARELDPEMRISNLSDRIGPFRPTDLTAYADALHKAGLPE